MKLLFPVFSSLLLLQEGAAFGVQPNNGSKTPTTTTSRNEFLQLTSAAAFASVMGVSMAAAENAMAIEFGGKIVFGEEEIMKPKEHGTSAAPVQENLLYGANNKLADKVCSFNRHFAENGGYFISTSFEDQVLAAKGPITFYDSVTGKPLFVAPINRSAEQFITESEVHGWPSFRDDEVVWENVRVLKKSGETVSADGTHLGHNLPDRSGNRYCINLVSIAGNPIA
uniref:Peptide-methionine (R)-S-oxide reductase n=2 Tax=Pseudo-nitzschia australis TaxID=44445 RepID=A0A7S4AEQ4_9STRA|mmetsp:Transcript_1659/g.3583  ORF Transcript_1659/g.3583 Transcript_1659/m.3583 type:complete len:226 (+) Transcript_1659:146-823(+)